MSEPNTAPIYIEADEEITSVVDRVRTSASKQITLVVPNAATLLQSIVNLKLLKRAADSSSTAVEIVTADRMGRNLAAQVGFTVFSSIDDQKAAKPFKAPAAAMAVSDIGPAKPKMKTREVPDEVPSPPPEAAAVNAESGPIKQNNGSGKRLFGFGLPALAALKNKRLLIVGGVLALLVTGFLLLTYVFAGATITITPKADSVTAESDVTADKGITTVSESGSIPAQVVSVTKDVSGTFQATGQKDIGTKASGTVNIVNCEDTSPHALPAGSKLSTGGGLIFVTASAITIPAGSFSGGGAVCNSGQTPVGVTASNSGDNYNVSSGQFAVVGLSSKINGTGSTSGGSSKKVTVVSQSDLDKAKAQLLADAQKSAQSDLKSKLASDQPILDGAIDAKIASFSSSAGADMQADNATTKATVTMTLVTYHSNDLKKVLISTIQKKISDTKQLLQSDKGVQASVTSVDATAGTLHLHGKLDGFIAAKFDTKKLQSDVRGKSIHSAQAYFTNNGDVAETDIKVWPQYKGSLPLFSNKITIKLANPRANS